MITIDHDHHSHHDDNEISIQSLFVVSFLLPGTGGARCPDTVLYGGLQKIIMMMMMMMVV